MDLELFSKTVNVVSAIAGIVILIALVLFVMACFTGEVKQVLNDITRKGG